MRIAVDARPFEECPTGVGRYLDGLLSAWLRARPEDSFVLLSPRPVHVPPRLEGRVAVPPTPALFGTIWLQTAAGPAARRAGADAFLGSLAILPLACGLPGVATVHDLPPILFPEWHSRKNRLGFTPFIGATVRRARRTVAPMNGVKPRRFFRECHSGKRIGVRSCTVATPGSPQARGRMPRLPRNASAPARRAAGPAAVCSQIVPKSAGVGGTATRSSRRGGTWTGRGDRRTKLSSGRARSQAESSPSR